MYQTGTHGLREVGWPTNGQPPTQSLFLLGVKRYNVNIIVEATENNSFFTLKNTFKWNPNGGINDCQHNKS